MKIIILGPFDCLPCFEGGVCLGGSNVALQKGYWRTHNLSEETAICVSDKLCLGGYNNNTCSLGHTGALCESCDISNFTGINNNIFNINQEMVHFLMHQNIYVVHVKE